MKEYVKGDRVVETWKGERRTGTIVEAYSTRPDGQGRATPLYAVQWDDDKNEIHRGYLGVGFERVK